jgi:hypothetical protein
MSWFDRETKEALKAEGICQQCGQRRAREELTECAECTVKRSRRSYKHRTELKARGLCTGGCGLPIDTERNGCYCGVCLDKHRAFDNRRHAERRAKSLCLQCGKPAVESRTRCLPHLIEVREQMRDRRAALRLAS